MAIVRIPAALRELAGGASELRLPGATVEECLLGLPAELKGRLFDGQGALRRYVNVFVRDEDIRYLQGLQTPVGEGELLLLVPAMAGG